MAVVALDTYEVVKELRAAGFDEAQAAALTAAVKRAQQIDLSELATKADLVDFATKADLFATKADLKGEIAEVRREISEAKWDVVKVMVGAIGIQTVLIIGGIVALLRTFQTSALPTP